MVHARVSTVLFYILSLGLTDLPPTPSSETRAANGPGPSRETRPVSLITPQSSRGCTAICPNSWPRTTF